VGHFLSSIDLQVAQLEEVVGRAIDFKVMHRAGQSYTPLEGQTIAVLGPCRLGDGQVGTGQSSIARLICEMAILQLGAVLPASAMAVDEQGRAGLWSEVFGNLLDAFVAEGVEHRSLESYSKRCRAPVINHSSDRFSPCRWLADVQTYQEHRGSIRGRRVVWVGRASAACRSFIQGTARLGYSLVISSPENQGPDDALVLAAGESVALVDNPIDAARDADLLVTDECLSVPPDSTRGRTGELAHGVAPDVIGAAKSNALLIRHFPSNLNDSREDVGDVHDDEGFNVSREAAENQLHVQKALLEMMLVA